MHASASRRGFGSDGEGRRRGLQPTRSLRDTRSAPALTSGLSAALVHSPMRKRAVSRGRAVALPTLKPSGVQKKKRKPKMSKERIRAMRLAAMAGIDDMLKDTEDIGRQVARKQKAEADREREEMRIKREMRKGVHRKDQKPAAKDAAVRGR